MNSIVLSIQSSNIQVRSWEKALSLQNITVVSKPPEASSIQIYDLLKNPDFDLPSLILVDSKLKNLDAYELCYWCCLNYPVIKIIVISDLEIVLPYDRHVAIDNGAWDLLPRLNSNNLDDINFRNSLNAVLKHLGILQYTYSNSPDKVSELYRSLLEKNYLLEEIDCETHPNSYFTIQSTSSTLKEQSSSNLSISTDTKENTLSFPKTYHSSKILYLLNIFSRFRLLIILFLLGILGLGSLWWMIEHVGSKTAQPRTDSSIAQDTLTPRVVARGKIVPEWDVIRLSVSNAQDSRVDKFFVRQGDRVQANQVIAILQGAEQRKVDLDAARANVELLQAQLEKVKQGDAKPAELAVQQAVIARLEAQFPIDLKQKQLEIDSALSSFKEAKSSYDRSQSLYLKGAISRADLDTALKDFQTSKATLGFKQADLEQSQKTFQNQISEAKAKLLELKQVQPIDIKIKQKELEQAVLEAKLKRVRYEEAFVRVPVSGQILRINTKVGEQVNTQLGIVDLGRTQKMYVQAEVYEADLPKVHKGQRASIVSEYGGFEGKIFGTVENLDLQVSQPTISEGKNNPTTDDNSRVVQVSIRIDPKDSSRVSSLSKMQVRVTISLSPT
jgi:HlyD family secretion protein